MGTNDIHIVDGFKYKSNKSNWFLIILISIHYNHLFIVNCKVYTFCEFGIALIANGIERSEVGKWICLGNAVSNLNSSKIAGTDPTKNREFGIFQITNYYYCWDINKQKNNDCNMNCTDLVDDKFEDDIKCAKLIKRRQGFSGGWSRYATECENKSLDRFTEGCDFIHGRSPIINSYETNVTFYLNSTEQQIICETEGTMPIILKWLKFDEEVRPSQYPVESVTTNSSKNSTALAILFNEVTQDTQGVYTCIASSAYGQVRKSFYVRVLVNNNTILDSKDASETSLDLRHPSEAPILIIIISVVITVSVTTLMFYVYYKCRPVKKGVLSKQEINTFYEGFTEKEGIELCDTISILDKIYSKPYRKFDFEIPEVDLQIGIRFKNFENELYNKKVVLGAGQFGIVYKGTYKQALPVAVKTIKPQERPEENRKQLLSLLDEVKVMSFIGEHPNIVSLIGALTKDLENNKLYVILEYCPVGSLKSYLRGQRSKTILECPDNSMSQKLPSSDYMPPPEKEDVYIKDFISYAYQIAYAMDYLTKKKIIHADLATRNVLLLDKNVAKVTDFGLSKRMSDYQEYIKNNQEFVPWRWWAIESLRDFTFTSKSDVWSYGVTLWEIFTLAEIPHPEHTWNPEFSQKLKDGLCLLKPDLASDNIYGIMSQCWNVDPDDRPTFHSICIQLRHILRKMSKFEGEYYSDAVDYTELVPKNSTNNIKL